MLGEGYSAANFETSGASVRRTESSELGLLLERDPRNCCIIRVMLRDTLGFLHLTQAVWGAAELVITGIDPQTSDASACRIQRSELGFILELDWKNVRLFC